MPMLHFAFNGFSWVMPLSVFVKYLLHYSCCLRSNLFLLQLVGFSVCMFICLFLVCCCLYTTKLPCVRDLVVIYLMLFTRKNNITFSFCLLACRLWQVSNVQTTRHWGWQKLRARGSWCTKVPKWNIVSAHLTRHNFAFHYCCQFFSVWQQGLKSSS